MFSVGLRVVVDVDLSKFFDRVNHDILIDRLRKRIDDAGVIRLVRAYLNSGVMDHGVVRSRDEGTPQGGPLSPLLANVMLDEVDKDTNGCVTGCGLSSSSTGSVEPPCIGNC
jgi:RNA-directed DNA polymerase